METLLDARWPAHSAAIAASVSSLRLVAACTEPKSLNHFLTTLLEGCDKKGQQQASLVILAQAVPQVAADELLSSVCERLPSKLIALLKAPAATSKAAAVECATALIRRLGQSAGLKKLLASFVGSLVTVLVGLLPNVSLTRQVCDCLEQCIENAGATVAVKAQSIRVAAVDVVLNSSLIDAETLAGLLVARAVSVERGDQVWCVMMTSLMHSLSVLANRVAPSVCNVAEPEEGASFNLTPAAHSRDAVADYCKLARVAELLLSSAAGQVLTIPTRSIVNHFSRVLRTDPSAQLPSATALHSLVVLKEHALSCLAACFGLARSAALLHHAAIMEILSASFAWSRSHSDAGLESVVSCFAAYVRHVPAGHLERPLLQSIVTVELMPIVAPHLALIVESRPALWLQMHGSARAAIENWIVSQVIEGASEMASLAARIVNASAHVDLPTLVVAAGKSRAHLATLALRMRPPASLWALPQFEMSQDQQASVSGGARRMVHVFAEAGVDEQPLKRQQEAPTEVAVANLHQQEKKARVSEEAEPATNALQVVSAVAEEEQQEEAAPIADYSSFQPTLERNVHQSYFQEEEGDEDNEDDDEPLPMIVDEPPSEGE